MSRKITKYSTELKTKLVLAVLSGDKTLNEIATANNILPKKFTELEKTIFRKCRDGDGTIKIN